MAGKRYTIWISRTFRLKVLVAVSSNNLDGNCRLTFWRMSSPCSIAYSHSLSLDEEKGDWKIGLDYHFLVVFSHAAETNCRKIYIISTETKTVLEKSTIPYSGYLSYEQGAPCFHSTDNLLLPDEKWEFH